MTFFGFRRNQSHSRTISMKTIESTADSPSGDYGFSIYTREPKAFSFYDWQKISMEKGKTAKNSSRSKQVKNLEA